MQFFGNIQPGDPGPQTIRADRDLDEHICHLAVSTLLAIINIIQVQKIKIHKKNMQ